VNHGRIGVARLRRTLAGLALPRTADRRLMAATSAKSPQLPSTCKWCEHSGHNPCYEEVGRFNAFMTGTVLAEATAYLSQRL
jgi:hypothetical protein